MNSYNRDTYNFFPLRNGAVEEILNGLGITYWSGGDKNFRVLCINPTHSETRPSLFIHKETGVLHCLGCGLKGNLFTLLRFYGITGIHAFLYLSKFAYSGGNYLPNESDNSSELLSVFHKERKRDTLDKYESVEVTLPPHILISEHPYLQHRGISQDEIIKWKMGVVTSGRNSGWILIPIYQDGILRTYFLRSTFGSGKLYGNYPRRDILAGIDFVKDNESSIAITEGIFDAIFVSRIGIKAVACLSNRLLPQQIFRLKRYRNIYIFPDNDLRGLDLVLSAGSLIHSSTVYVCVLPENKKDAAECSTDELMMTYSSAYRWSKIISDKIINRIRITDKDILHSKENYGKYFKI